MERYVLDEEAVFSHEKQLVNETMNGKTLQVCDKLIYPICALCRDHKKNGFIGGVKVGFLTTTGIIGRTVISGGREYVYCIK